MSTRRTGKATPVLAATALATCLVASLASAQPAGTQYVTFWRGDLRIIATSDQTRVTLINIDNGLPLPATGFSGNFATNPFVLASEGDSFEGTTTFNLTQRVRVVSEDATGAGADKPVVVWTGTLGAALKHPLAPPADQNAWMSYVPDIQQNTERLGSELGEEFMGFTTRDMWVFADASTGTAPRIRVDDLATNTDFDSDDTLFLDAASPYLVHADADVEIYRYSQFEDDTFRLTSNVPTSVLVGISSAAFPDWTATPPAYGTGERGRELGTRFHVFASRWLTIMPVLDETTVEIVDLSDGDDSDTFTLQNGDRFNPIFDLYISDPLGRRAQPFQPRASGPMVVPYTPPTGPIDDDVLTIRSDRPILVQIGPVSSDTFEFADVAYSVPVGPTEQLIYAYAQNGGAEDFQLFSFRPDNPITITSLSFTQGFGTVHHDVSLPATPFSGGNMTTNDWYWSSPTWGGELLRIESQYPVQIMGGDYDSPNFGAFLPVVTVTPTGRPVADAGPDLRVCPGEEVTLDGSASFDSDLVEGDEDPAYSWDLDVSDDSDGNGTADDDEDSDQPVVVTTFPPGSTTVKLTYSDDEGESSVDFVTVIVEDVEPPVPECPALVVATATTFDGGDASPIATATDECDDDVALRNDRTAGGADATDFYPCGTTLVTFTAEDDEGNSASCSTVVRIVADSAAMSVGPTLRLTKMPDGSPRLDWSLAGAPPPRARYTVLRAAGRRPPVDVAPGARLLDVTSWLGAPADGRLVFYDVRAILCDGALSAD